MEGEADEAGNCLKKMLEEKNDLGECLSQKHCKFQSNDECSYEVGDHECIANPNCLFG